VLGFTAATDCICFPPDEPPSLQLKTEIEAAEAVLCPLHGARFSVIAPMIYRATTRPAHLEPEKWSWRSQQYIKAMEASFPPDRWPATRINETDGSISFELKDGTEIYRIEPPPVAFDYDAGLPVADPVKLTRPEGGLQP
jgi:hypothetical protein